MESDLLNDEQTYLQTELANVQQTITSSIDTFTECSQNVTMIFETNFKQVQETINACTAV